MAQVQISLDTVTKECVLTVDGNLVSQPRSVRLYKHYYGEDPELSFSYTVKVDSGDGLMELREFFMPPTEEEVPGLAGKLHSRSADKDKLVEDIQRFFSVE